MLQDVHFGNICEDLSYLLITSASPDTRRRQHLAIIRHYYYSLLDLCIPQFKIMELKDAFMQMHKYAVVMRQIFSAFRLIFSNFKTSGLSGTKVEC